MRHQTVTLYEFAELSDDAKDRARDWWRNQAFEYGWWDSVYEDIKMCAAILGIEIDRIYFSGFWSQGDGACFEGYYAYKPGWRKALRDQIGDDDLAELEAIGEALQDIQRRAFYRLTASTRQSGHYMHSGCMDVSVDASGTPNITETHWGDEDPDFTFCADGIRDELRRFADWIYARLEQEYEFLSSDEQVDANLIANEYEFTEEGDPA